MLDRVETTEQGHGKLSLGGFIEGPSVRAGVRGELGAKVAQDLSTYVQGWAGYRNSWEYGVLGGFRWTW